MGDAAQDHLKGKLFADAHLESDLNGRTWPDSTSSYDGGAAILRAREVETENEEGEGMRKACVMRQLNAPSVERMSRHLRLCCVCNEKIMIGLVLI